MELKKTRTLVLILLLAFLLRFQPVFFLGYSDPDTFFHERNIETIIQQKNAFFFDALSQQGRYYSNFPLFHEAFVFAKLSSGLPTNMLLLLLPALFGAFISLFVFLFAKRIFSERTALFAAFSLAIMPLNIIRTNGVARPDALAMLFLLCCLFAVFLKKNKTAIFFAFAIALTNPVPTSGLLVGMLLFASVVLWTKKEKSFFSIALAIALVSALAFLAWTLHYPIGFEEYYSNIAMNALELERTDAAWLLATLKFSWLFVLFGFFWAKKNIFLKAWLAFCFAVSFIAVRISLFFALPAAIFSGVGIMFFQERIESEKSNMMLAVFFAMLFTLALVNVFPEALNSRNYLAAEEKSGILWLKNNSAADANVASQWDFGDPIAALTQRAVIIDGHFEFNPGVGQRYKDEIRLENSLDCDEMEKIIQKYKTNYFFADKEAMHIDFNCAFANRVFDANKARVFAFN